MEWVKKGLIYSCDFFGTGYAQDAFVDILNNDIWRIYYSTRTKEIVSLPFYIDVQAGNPTNIFQIPTKPLAYPGDNGKFDDSGITMTSIVKVDDDLKYLYYCGWNKKVSVPYMLSIGVLEVRNNRTYKKIFDGPIMDRSKHNPIAVSAPFVIYDKGIFKMWYISFTQWKVYNDRMEPTFVIKYSTSSNGIDWITSEDICIDSTYDGESFARPWVLKDNGVYKMWFSKRGPIGYREKGDHYLIEYAESLDGENWKRKPISLNKSDTGWDSEMMAYASVIKENDIYYMLYNGNNFGKTGFGYAIFKK